MPIQPLDICIDVSDAQGSIDWPAVRGAGIRIAFVKATEGASFVARSFERNRTDAARNGVAVIPYSFLRPGLATPQIQHFREVTGLEEGMAFALDWEGRASTTASPQVAEAIGEELAQIANRKPIGYWGISGSTPAAPTMRMLQWPRWIPRYPVVGINSFAALPPRCQEAPEVWWHTDNRLPEFAQYTSWGRVPGIKGLVDRSVAFFPSVDDALTWCTGKAPAPPADAGNLVAATGAAAGSASPAPAGSSAPGDGDESADDLNRAELTRLKGE